MNPKRRQWLQAMAALAAPGGLGTAAAADPASALAVAGGDTSDRQQAGPQDSIQRGRALVFPRDHGAHIGTRTEWWYATGWLGTPEQPTHGFQVTFFRSRTGLALRNTSRFAARQLLFAHAAVTDLAGRRHVHDQRIARWNGVDGAGPAASASTPPRNRSAVGQGDVRLQDWSLVDDGSSWLARVSGGEQQAAGDGHQGGTTADHHKSSSASGADANSQFRLDLRLQRSQPLLLQGDAGLSRKGPQEQQASHYYSEPQLAASATVTLGRQRSTLQGRGWMDHEWSNEILHPDAVGWDWIGMNLFDGSALTAFVLRRRDGSALWAGGSFRAAPLTSANSVTANSFAPDAVRWQPGRVWRSPGSGASYPVEWALDTPAGRFSVRALADAQELDSRASTGTIYWEGVSELRDAQGRRVGLGYLEMTGYAARIAL